MIWRIETGLRFIAIHSYRKELLDSTGMCSILLALKCLGRTTNEWGYHKYQEEKMKNLIPVPVLFLLQVLPSILSQKLLLDSLS